ncbi:hypothetical protein AB870_20555 [Pandoraea faecigallinarum]|uniref:t-SNARE coiled-coil homology domain-containing protein n=1 Tax=Pandoraea faecigallinarum TaxID=656179 RepID=A0A0H3WZK2_9BURK|nr:hypothetical protein [Pandoraea faecigallinarum]AKM31986.1 hypothetical protein AB870_20555 [Pandoraea faecigallinarum]
MRTYLEGIQANASQRLDDMMWDTLDTLKGGQQETMRRLDGLENRTNRQFAELQTRLSNRMDGIETRFDGLDRRIDGVENRLDGLSEKFDVMRADLKRVIAAQEAHSCGREAAGTQASGSRLESRSPPVRANSWGYSSKHAPHMA